MKEYLLEMKGISKTFFDQQVLRDINIILRYGEIHAIIGENGAGKSTLMNILAGAEEKSSGEIYLEGKKVSIQNPHQAKTFGISTIYQEVQLIPSLTVLENIFLGHWPIRFFKWLPIINWKSAEQKVSELFELLQFDIDPYLKASNLSMGQKKMVEIAKALCWNSKILIIDEVTEALNDYEIERLFDILKKTKEMGISIFFISHKINEVMRIADTVTILRDGSLIETRNVEGINAKLIAYKMAGDKFIDRYPKIKPKIGKEVLRVEHLCDSATLKDINFSIKRGEILGLAGLEGSGRSAVAEAIFGVKPLNKGKIFINGREVKISSPIDAIRNKIGFIPENRREALFYKFGIHKNISLANMKSVTTKYNIDLTLEKKLAQDYVQMLGIKVQNVTHKIKYLSGGNQQKVIIARCFLTGAKIFIFDQPTRELDIPSKVHIYNLMNEIIMKDGSIFLISSDLDELLGMCDRILVMHKGTIVKELRGKEMNEANIVYYATGGVSSS